MADLDREPVDCDPVHKREVSTSVRQKSILNLFLNSYKVLTFLRDIDFH